MSLQKLEEDIQSRESKAVKRKHNTTVYNEWQSKDVESKESTWQLFVDKMQNVRVRAIVIGGIAISTIIVVLLLVGSFVFYQKGFFAQDRVHLNINAPQNSQSNQTVEIAFSYENDNRANLENAEIAVRFGNYFVPVDDQENYRRVSEGQGIIEIGSIKGGHKGLFTLAGHFVGPRDEIADISGTLRYTPEEATTRYTVNARSSTIITSSPIIIDIESSSEVVSGNLLDIAIKIQNTSADTLSDLKLETEFPKSFSLYNTEPRTNRGNTWFIDRLLPQSEMTFHVRGSVDAPIGTVPQFRMKLGTQESVGAYVMYASAGYAPRIVGSPIIVRQEIESPHEEDVVYAGETMRYRVFFTNDSDIALRNAILTLSLEGEAVDFENLQLNDQGNYDQQNRRIIWKASDVPALRSLSPKESGEVTFTLGIKEQLPVNNSNDHHFSITSVAVIDSEDIPSQLRENKAVLSNVATIPIGAKVILGSSSAHKSGPEPPKVGEKTIYTISMKIDNINNDIEDTKVNIALPTHTSFEGSDSDMIEYNERTNNLVWDVGRVTHGAGITSDPIVVAFDVAIVPSIDQVKKTPTLIKEQILMATDVFTELPVKSSAEEKNTSSDGRSNERGSVIP
jgi:hypothetical protein